MTPRRLLCNFNDCEKLAFELNQRTQEGTESIISMPFQLYAYICMYVCI